MSGLLETKRIPPAKAAEAAIVALTVIGIVAYSFHHLGEWMENSFHVFDHTAAENVQEIKRHPSELLGAMMMFPILAATAMGILIPVAVYVGDHAAFNDLHIARPDHLATLLVRVYRSWAASNGKLASKDL